MNTYSKELCHWGIELGAKRDNHKYIARVETKPGKYIYFYDMNKYNAWKNGAKNKVQNTAKSIKNKAEKTISKNITPKVSQIKNTSNKTANRVVRQLSESKTMVDDAVKKYKSSIQTEANNIKTEMQKRVESGKKVVLQNVDNVASSIGPKVKELSKDISEQGRKAATIVKNTTNATIDSVVKKTMSLKLEGAKQQKKSVLEKAKNFVSHMLHAYTGKLADITYGLVNGRNSDKTPTITANPKGKNGAYLAEVEYPDGRKVKIKNKKDWDRYAEVLRYQNNEQEFMHSMPEIQLNDDGSMPTQAQDRAEVNEKVNSGGYRTVNCIFCSTAYELRRRGYDVEAPNLASDVNAMNISKIFNVKDSVAKKDTQIITTDQKIDGSFAYGNVRLKDVSLNANGGFKYTYEINNYDLENRDPNIKSFVPVKDVEDAYVNRQSSLTGAKKDDSKWKISVTKNLEKVTSDFPDNSRGMINVYWSGGGGHSLVWEKDDNGKLSIYDTQVDAKIDPIDLMRDVDPGAPVQVIRTDNLKLNRGVLDRIVSN